VSQTLCDGGKDVFGYESLHLHPSLVLRQFILRETSQAIAIVNPFPRLSARKVLSVPRGWSIKLLCYRRRPQWVLELLCCFFLP
jgi:hypothetical protein